MKVNSRKLAIFLTVILCLICFSVSVFASEGGDSIEETTHESLTPQGNLTLIDDYVIYGGEEGDTPSSKQFITMQSKSGNYFYLIIDRAGETENVHFLNLVDEADLLTLTEGEEAPVTCSCQTKCRVGDIQLACDVCRTNMSECEGAEPREETDVEPITEQEESSGKSGSGGSLPILVLLVFLAGGGGFFWLKLRKKPSNTAGSSDLDDYDFGEDAEDETLETDEADEIPEEEDRS